MDSRSEIVKCVSRIWRLYKQQESLCRSAMGLEMPGRFRCLLGDGYMIYALFKREIGCIYEEVKCSLNDGELASIVRSPEDLSHLNDSRSAYISKLIAGQQDLNEAYKVLLTGLLKENRAVQICSEHVEKLSEFSLSLASQGARLIAGEPVAYGSVA